MLFIKFIYSSVFTHTYVMYLALIVSDDSALLCSFLCMLDFERILTLACKSVVAVLKFYYTLSIFVHNNNIGNTGNSNASTHAVCMSCWQVEGRSLPPEEITFGNKTVSAGIEADWGRELTRSSVISAVSAAQHFNKML